MFFNRRSKKKLRPYQKQIGEITFLKCHLSITWKHLLKLILQRNSFSFNEKYYLQTTGVAMGQKCAPELCDIMFQSLEKKFISLSVIQSSNGIGFVMIYYTFG